ncbi:hypothetical protein [Xanthobacter sp. KR7-225]|uniref:hypothetical protein n=1 Tax=Xanthobacter sp. KR7-225 TaxID=3156613 RepID=UPI0032B43872
MRKIALAAGGALVLGLLALSAPASAASIPSSGSALLGPVETQAGPQEVRWRRVCRQVRVWRYGRWRWVTRCKSVWVGPRCGPGWGRPCW